MDMIFLIAIGFAVSYLIYSTWCDMRDHTPRYRKPMLVYGLTALSVIMILSAIYLHLEAKYTLATSCSLTSIALTGWASEVFSGA